ncbi:MAG: phage tail length tape measure family protein [Pseudomonadaceae bacterium]|nr:phage tail length tape measure family protein [Pseudomonadaceae bacterium]
MADIASLGIKIDTSSVQKAEGDLDKLTRTAASTEQAAGKVGTAWAQAGDKMGKAAAPAAKVADAFKQGSAAMKAQQDELAGLIGKIDPVAAAYGRLDDQLASLRKFKTAGLLDTESFRDYSAKIEAARNSLGGMETAIRKTGISSAQTANAMRQMPAQITDIFTSLAGGQNPLLVLIQQGGQIKDSFGGIGNTFQALKEHVRGLFSSASSVDADGLLSIGAGLASIAEQQAALAQGAQPASEGLGSLADSANSATETAGNARGAIGGLGLSAGAATGLFVVAAAAAAVLALAYKQGSDEATAYSKAIVLTGNIAGTSAGQMQSMAAAIDLVSGTQANAASALAETASSGKFAATQIEAIATAAVAMESATGKAVSNTVAEFARLADEPVSASEKLNEQYHYLTAAIYEQIQALDEQGNHAAAAELAIATFGDAMESRAKQIRDNLGVIEGGWDAIKRGAAEAWDEMLGVGRTQTPDARLKELQGGATVDAGAVAANGLVLGPLGALYEGYKQAKATLGENDGSNAAEIVALQKEISERDQKAFDEGQKAKINAEAIAAEKRLKLQTDANKTQSDKRKDAQDKYQRDIASIKKANPLSAFVTDAAIASGIAGINDDFKDKAAPKTKKAATVAAYQDDAATKMLQSLREQGAALNEQLTTTGKLTAAEREQVKFSQLIADLKSKDILTADQKSLLANQDSITAQLAKNAAVADEVAKRTELNKLQERGAQLQETMAAALEGAKDQHADVLGASGAGKQEMEQIKAQSAIRKQYQRFQRDLDKATPASLLGSDSYASEVAKIKLGLGDALDESADYYKELKKQQKNWAKGAEKGFQNYLDNAADMAGDMAGIVEGTLTSITDGISDSFANALIQGDDLETSLSNIATTIETQLLSALIKMGLQYGINAALEVAADGTVTAAKVASTATLTTTAVASTATVAGAQAPAAAATTAAWAPAAAVSSVASFGAAAAIGLAALIAVMAMAKGFKTGGYTGNGGVSDAAGVVHGQEYVFDAATTKRIGVDNLDAMRAGQMAPIRAAASNDISYQNRSVSQQSAPVRGGQVINNFVLQGRPDNRTQSQIAMKAGKASQRNQSRFG